MERKDESTLPGSVRMIKCGVLFNTTCSAQGLLIWNYENQEVFPL